MFASYIHIYVDFTELTWKYSTETESPTFDIVGGHVICLVHALPGLQGGPVPPTIKLELGPTVPSVPKEAFHPCHSHSEKFCNYNIKNEYKSLKHLNEWPIPDFFRIGYTKKEVFSDKNNKNYLKGHLHVPVFVWAKLARFWAILPASNKKGL